MRYDPLNQAIARILEAGSLGAPLHAFFENYASDTPLGPGHWFWKPEISGGIFIEHGVHFFDLFRMWFGSGEVVGGAAVGAAERRHHRPGPLHGPLRQCAAREFLPRLPLVKPHGAAGGAHRL
jgi:predicted dehydrogenase